MSDAAPTNIVLVHGGWHGAWCWRDPAEILAARGFKVHAVDLPGLGEDRTPPKDVTLAAYAERAAEAVRKVGGRTWLVGHSMGGGVVTQAAEYVADQLDGVIYLSAVLPLNGETILGHMSGESVLSRYIVVDEQRGMLSFPEEHLRECFYHMCSDEAVARAIRLLTPLQPMRPNLTPVSTTPERFGSLPLHFIECLQDQAMPLATQREIQQKARFTSVESLDSDHSPFMSCPEALADAICRIVLSSVDLG